MKKLLSIILSVLMLMALLPSTGVAETSAEYNAFKQIVQRIDSQNPYKAPQAYRVEWDKDNGRWINYQKRKHPGICNISATTTLLNRRLAYDNKSGKFTIEDSLRSNGCTKIKGPYNWINIYKNTKKKNGYSYSGDSCYWWEKTYTNSDGVQYTTKHLKPSTIDSEYIIAQLMQHPEGIVFYLDKVGHAIVVTDYERDGNKVKFYVNDPVNNTNHQLFTNCWVAKEYGLSNIYDRGGSVVVLKNSSAVLSDPGSDYLAQCREYTTYGSVKANASVTLWSLPCESSVCSASTANVSYASGKTFTVTGLYKNTKGQYWYKTEYNGEKYFYSGDTTWRGWYNSDITLTNAVYPSQLTQGSSFSIGGTIASRYNLIIDLYARCYYGSSTSGNPAISSSDEGVNTRNYGLQGSKLDNNLKFGQLSNGSYTFVLLYRANYYYSENGTSITGKSASRVLHSNAFSVGSPATYTVTLNPNGGTVSPSSITVTYNKAYGSLPNASRTGYNFDGWYTSASGGSRVTSTTTVTTAANHTLYAHWTAKTYTVSLNANGGSVSPSSITVYYGSSYGYYNSLPTPTRSGYSFSGWYTAASGGSYVSNSTTVTTAGNHTLYAHWSGNGVAVYFNANGGSVSTDGKIVYYEQSYGWLPEATRTGYNFDGWYTSPTGGSQVTTSTVVSTTSSHTLYAHWTAKTYTVTKIRKEGDTTGSTFTVTYGSPYGDELNSHPLTVNSQFLGWFTEREGGTQVTSETIVTTAGDHALYAHVSYIIRVMGYVDGKGKTNISGVGSFDVYVNGEKMVDDCETYYAQTIQIDAAGTYEVKDIRVGDGYSFAGIKGSTRTGTLEQGRSVGLNFATVHPEEWLDAHEPEEYTNDGNTYLFFSEPATWYEAKTISEYLGGHLLRIDSYAENSFINNVTDQAECWLGAMDVTYGEELERLFVWNGDGSVLESYYTNWAYDQPGNDTNNDEGGSNFVYMTSDGEWATTAGCTKRGFVCEIEPIESDIDYDYIIVTLDPNGGDVWPDCTVVDYWETYGELPEPTWDGYTFVGWYTDPEDGMLITEDSIVEDPDDHTLYAHWTEDAVYVTVTLDPNGGEVSPDSITVIYGEAYGELPEPTWDGYAFVGWYTDPEYGMLITEDSIVEDPEDHTLYAYWLDGDLIPFDGWIEWNEEDVDFKGTTPYVIADGLPWEPRFTVYDGYGNEVDESCYDYEYYENCEAGTGYVYVVFTNVYYGAELAWFKIYLPATTATTVANVSNGIKITWAPVEGAAGYVVYRRAWSSTTNGWTTFERWNNTPDLSYVDTAVYAGTRYQYGVKGYFTRRIDPISGAQIGGNVGDNYNLGMVGPLKTTVRITTRTLSSLTAGSRSFTANWDTSKLFTGYQIKYSTDANFKSNVKTTWISNWRTGQTTIKSLQSGTTYYVCVRSYHVFEGVNYFGEWSNVRSCKVR